MAERCALFIIICLGESILVTGATFAELEWTPAVIAAFASALLGSIAMWWIYFSAHAEAAAHAIAESDDPGRIARLAYTYMHIPLVAGIIVTAAGDELVLAHATGHVEPATACVVVGGPLLYLAGATLFKFSVFRLWSAARIAGIAALIAIGFVAMSLTPLTLTLMTTAVLVAVGAGESVQRMLGKAASDLPSAPPHA